MSCPQNRRVILALGQKVVEATEDHAFIQCLYCAQQYCCIASDSNVPIDCLMQCPTVTEALKKGSQPPHEHPVWPSTEDPFERKEGDRVFVELETGHIYVARVL